MAGVRTIVLVGCTGNGKSATGNSILGHNAFKSMSRFGGVTTTCQLSSTVLQDGEILNVIDTPGLFDSSASPEYVEKEIVRCIQLAKDGIHAVLIVVSLRVRFSKEQAAVIDGLKHLFGTRIVDYMIVAFTGGDELAEDETLDNYLASCPEALKELLEKCGNRRVVFDNKTMNAGKKAEQLRQLLTLIDDTMQKNRGQPYTRDSMLKFKNEDAAMGNGSKQAYNEEQTQQLIAETVHKKLKEINEEIITKLEKDFEKLQKRNEEMVNNLKEELQRAQRESDERMKAKNKEKKLKRQIRELQEELESAKSEFERQPLPPVLPLPPLQQLRRLPCAML